MGYTEMDLLDLLLLYVRRGGLRRQQDEWAKEDFRVRRNSSNHEEV
jgi:hypothetical protein